MAVKNIDLNCDLGEYEQLFAAQNDALIMPWISSCNIACGGHAGNQVVIKHSIKLAQQNAVNIGAHPSFPDRENFGRQVMVIDQKDLRTSLQQQITAVKTLTEASGSVLSHVKPHGALYNLAAVDDETAKLLVETVAGIDENLMFYGLAHSAMATAANHIGMCFVAEGFADRAYTLQKTLVSRSQHNALIEEPEKQLSQVLQMLTKQQVNVTDDDLIDINIDTVCLHGDHFNSVKAASYLYRGLQQAGFEVLAPTR